VAEVQGSVGTETMMAIGIGSEESRAWGQDLESVTGVLEECARTGLRALGPHVPADSAARFMP
jgi:hypothetical protein